MMNRTPAFLGKVGGERALLYIKQCIHHADRATFMSVEEVVLAENSLKHLACCCCWFQFATAMSAWRAATLICSIRNLLVSFELDLLLAA